MNNWLFFQNAGVGPMQGQAKYYPYFIVKKMNCNFFKFNY